MPLALGLAGAGAAGIAALAKKKKRSAGNALGSPSLVKGLAKRRAKTMSKAVAPRAVAGAMGTRGLI